MKKLLSILTISSLTVSIPAPLLGNTTLTRVKRDVGTNSKDVTTGFDIKIKNEWNKIYANEKPFSKIDDKWYIAIWGRNNWNINKFKYTDWLINILERCLKWEGCHYFQMLV